MSVPADVTNQYYNASDDVMVGWGKQLEVSNGASPPVWEAIAAISEIVPGSIDTADVKTTHLRVERKHHTHRSGMRDASPFELKGMWLPDHRSQSNAGGGSGPFATGGLLAMSADGENRDFRIALTDGSPYTYWQFRGYVSKFQPGGFTTADQPVDFSAAIQPSEAYDLNLP